MALLDVFKKSTSDNESKAVVAPAQKDNGLIENTESMLMEVNMDLSKVDAVELPIAKLGALGGGVASLLPALRTVSNSVSYTDNGLYRCIFPKGVKGYLATAHNDGLNIGTIMNEKGIAAQARWVKAGPQTLNVSSLAPVNPATLMMAAAIMSIEKKLDDIAEMEKQILSFLEEDKESKIEGDLKILTTIVKEYKFNWDNDAYISTHHHLVAMIKRDANSNIIFYQKQISASKMANPALFLHQFIDATQATLIKKFKYYRLSLYLYGFASFMEVMLQGKFEQEYIDLVRQEIIDRTAKYQEDFDNCFRRLEKLTDSCVEHHLLKGLGVAGKAVGSFIGSLPVVKEGSIDEWLIENGDVLKQYGENFGKETLKQFSALSDPKSSLFIDNLVYVNRLFNQTQEIYIGKDSIYLVKNTAA